MLIEIVCRPGKLGRILRRTVARKWLDMKSYTKVILYSLYFIGYSLANNIFGRNYQRSIVGYPNADILVSLSDIIMSKISSRLQNKEIGFIKSVGLSVKSSLQQLIWIWQNLFWKISQLKSIFKDKCRINCQEKWSDNFQSIDRSLLVRLLTFATVISLFLIVSNSSDRS